jgi:hypothetical protein
MTGDLASKQARDRPHPTAAELRRLPLEERNAILQAQAAAAEPIYRGDPDLTDFETFGEDDLHGDSSSAEEEG